MKKARATLGSLLSAMVIMAATLLPLSDARADYAIKDGTGTSQTVFAFSCSSKICPGYVPVDLTGAVFGVTGNPFFVTNNGTFAVQATEAGTWTVTGAGGTFPVTGTFWQATQPVSGTFWQATQPVSIASMPSTPVTGTFWRPTHPVPGTVTENAVSATQAVSIATAPALVAS